MATIVQVVGARPNYVKVAALWRAVATDAPDVTQHLVDTGQHARDDMSGTFRRELGLPDAGWRLGVQSADRLSQIAAVATAVADVLVRVTPDVVVVVGDVNSTLGAAVAAASLGLPVAHVEAGLRSGDRSMPEELNRVATDRLSDLLFTTSRDAGENLAREGVPPSRVHFVGNVMIDTLVHHLPEAVFDRVAARFAVERGAYAVCTLHRPSNVDVATTLARVLDELGHLGRRMPVVFPVHPRTCDRLRAFGLAVPAHGVHVSDPLGYLDFLSLVRHAALVVTDSGGLQEEAIVLGVPCVTLRANTERPVTLEGGANRLADPAAGGLADIAMAALRAPVLPAPPELWDGRAAARVVGVMRRTGVLPRAMPAAVQA